MRSHPLRQYLARGISCVQGTDGGALYGTNSIDEELSLEKLLGLSHEELCQMRAAEAEIERESLAVFAEKSERFERLCAGDAPEAYLRRRIAEAAPVQAELFTPGERLDAVRELAGQICPLPQGKTPVVLAGGSFNSDRHETRLRAQDCRIIDALLREGDPDKIFFVIGHRLCGYERYLI